MTDAAEPGARRRAAVVAFAIIACASIPALAYNEAVHAWLTGKAFAGRAAWLSEELAPPAGDDLAALRALYWRTASELPDASLRGQFLARYPAPAALDAWAFKELFMLDPAATVHGVDPEPGDAPLRRGELLARASRWPDDDERNQHRYLHDDARQVVRSSDGNPVPYDPGTLALGSLTGHSSQGHGHYGLVPGPLSDDPEVLKNDPRHFAVPKTAHGYGADFAQLYTDLSLLAHVSRLRSAGWLSSAFAGACFHHLEDVANQIHTVQVGIYDFFEAAFVQSKLRDVRTLGGLFGERRSLEQLGLRIIGNHHLLSEDLFAKRIAEGGATGELGAALASAGSDDAQLLHAAEDAVAKAGGPSGEFARAITDAVVEQSSREAPEVYRLVWAFSTKSMHDGAGHEFTSGPDDPDRFVRADPAAQAALQQFYALESKGLRRATTALRLWQRNFDAAAAQDPELVRVRAVQRTLAFLLPYHAQAAARRAAFHPAARGAGVAWAYPIAALFLAGLGVGLATRAARRRRAATSR